MKYKELARTLQKPAGSSPMAAITILQRTLKSPESEYQFPGTKRLTK